MAGRARPKVPKQQTPWVKSTRTDPHTGKTVPNPLEHGQGVFGEQGMGFHSGEQGFDFFDVGGAGGHAGTEHGIDGVAFNRKTGEIIIYDNYEPLAETRVRTKKPTGILHNLEKNLDDFIAKMERDAGKMPGHAQQDFKYVLGKLKEARAALKSGKWPSKVRLAVTNTNGLVKGMSKKLEKMGIELIDPKDLKKLRRPALMNKLKLKALRSGIRELAKKEEAAALRRLARRGAAGAAAAARKAMPKVVAKMLLKKSAGAAASRVGSFIPLVGWGFAGKDAANGVEDILRGHTARGLAGVGLAVGDVIADFVHIGDAVSGVGGTALSIALQGAAVAGQIKIEMDRQKDKMDELQKEIEEKNALPPDNVLRDKYGMDDEDIAELKAGFAAAGNDDVGPEDLPDPPSWEDDPELQMPPPPRLKPPSLPSPAPRPAPAQTPAPTPAPAPTFERPEHRWVDQPIA